MDEESQNSVTINDSPANFETTKRELYAWYSYEAGISTVASVGMSFVVPLLLDLIAFNSGSSYPVNDASPSSLPDFSTLPNSNWFNYGTCIAGNTTAYTPSSREYYDICVVPWGGTYIRHTTWALSVISVSVGIQAFCFISLGSLSDHGRLRKFLLLCFTIIQIVAAVGLIIPFTKEWFFGAGVLVVVLNVGIGVSGVITNSYLPIFTKNDPDVIQAFAGVDEKSSWEKYEQARKVSENVANRLSAIGYLSGGISAALFTVIAALFIVFLDQNLGLRLSMLTSGVILFALSLPFWFWVRERPGPPLPKGQIPIVYSWITLFKTLFAIPKIPRTFVFLLCYYLYSDAYTTITSVAVLFARTELKVTSTQLVSLVLIVPFSASLGNYVFMVIQSRFKLSAKSCVLTCLGIYTFMTVYGALGLIDSWSIGLKQMWELYFWAVVHGFILGPVQSYTRVIYAELIPEGKEAEFFGLFEITNKGSSWIGPLVVGAINQASGRLRFAYIFLSFSFFIPIPIIYLLNVGKGRVAANRYSDSLNKKEDGDIIVMNERGNNVNK